MNRRTGHCRRRRPHRPRGQPVPQAVRGGIEPHHRGGQVDVAQRPEEPDVTEGEHPAIARRQPIPLTRRRQRGGRVGRDIDDRHIVATLVGHVDLVGLVVDGDIARILASRDLDILPVFGDKAHIIVAVVDDEGMVILLVDRYLIGLSPVSNLERMRSSFRMVISLLYLVAT